MEMLGQLILNILTIELKKSNVQPFLRTFKH